MDYKNYSCEGQISITDYFKAKIFSGNVMCLTEYINSHGNSQYEQIRDVIKNAYESEKYSGQLIERLTNSVSVYVLKQSIGYMEYLKKECDFVA